jgi:hypothetical protein
MGQFSVENPGCLGQFSVEINTLPFARFGESIAKPRRRLLA